MKRSGGVDGNRDSIVLDRNRCTCCYWKLMLVIMNFVPAILGQTRFPPSPIPLNFSYFGATLCICCRRLGCSYWHFSMAAKKLGTYESTIVFSVLLILMGGLQG